MENLSNYIMSNYPLDMDTNSVETIYSSESPVQMGGAENQKDRPTGGFPPIYLCAKGEDEELFKEEEKTKREYKTHQQSVTLKDILEKRKKATPFFPIPE